MKIQYHKNVKIRMMYNIAGALYNSSSLKHGKTQIAVEHKTGERT